MAVESLKQVFERDFAQYGDSNFLQRLAKPACARGRVAKLILTTRQATPESLVPKFYPMWTSVSQSDVRVRSQRG